MYTLFYNLFKSNSTNGYGRQQLRNRNNLIRIRTCMTETNHFILIFVLPDIVNSMRVIKNMLEVPFGILQQFTRTD